VYLSAVSAHILDTGSHSLIGGGLMLRVNLEQGYEQFLEMPVPVVLVVLWVGGVVLEVLGVAALYSLYWNGQVMSQLLDGNL
jgi:hypothetical protein